MSIEIEPSSAWNLKLPRLLFQVRALPQPHMTPLTAPSDKKESLWFKCPECNELTYIREFIKHQKVCPHCQYHAQLRWYERLSFLLDDSSFLELDYDLETLDPLEFQTDKESYQAKIQQIRSSSNTGEALVTGIGNIQGKAVALAVTEFSFMGASMGSVFGEKLTRLIEYAIENRLPVVTISSSGGARMHEGVFSLFQMAKTTAALVQLGKARLPHISVLVNPCYGGVTASYATLADVVLAEPGALIGFAGPRVIEQTTNQKLPAGFQTASFLREHGMVDELVQRKTLRETLFRLLNFFDPDFL
ncbi:MAG TPA: acetyl-CoA carboxylase, carboxyltransferase subunit beta [Chloroflexia bacterium]|nr:acetyl-CoA carboxylase, carboxyltransferase subunit beta [Chloroflexia bacterium]